jgi:hypothetical protein
VRSAYPKLAVLAGVVFFSGALVGCTGANITDPWEVGGGSDDGGSPASDGAPTTSDSGGASASDSGRTLPDSSTPAPEAGTAAPSPPDGGSDDSSAPAEAGPPPVTSGDGFAASRMACINKINALRASDTAVALQPLTLQNTDDTNSCVDKQATNDQSVNTGHYSFNNKSPSCNWGNPSAEGQNECLIGYGTSPQGIEHCLQDMWDESLKPNCQGCIGCTTFGGACPNCDYSGTLGYECGHYVNMSAPYFTSVACGFAGEAPSSDDGWSVQNFE